MAKPTAHGRRVTYKKSLGQHFLYDEALLDLLVDAAGVTDADAVLEIGPGSGSLTAALARRARRVLALELDRDLLPLLAVTLAAYPNAEVRQGDARTEDLAALIREMGAPCRLVANLPYYITTPLLLRILTEDLPLSGIAVMVQAEVGEKLTARPGTPAYGPLAVWAQALTVPRVAVAVPAAAFEPRPKVDSSFMRLTPRETPLVPPEHRVRMERMLRAAFGMRRKTLANNMQNACGMSKEEAVRLLASNGLALDVRGEALPPETLYSLSNSPEFTKRIAGKQEK